jgi:hypothetical protein
MGAVFIAIQHVSGGGWATLFRRVPEAMTAYLPAGAAAMAVLFLGVPTLYPWAGPHADELIRGKEAFLTESGFRIRAALWLAAWILLSRRLVANSRAQDESGDVATTRSSVRLSAVFLVVFAATFSLAAIEWLMSLEPRWYSTIYPWYVFSGVFVQGLAVLTLLVLYSRRGGLFPELNQHHLHDLGKLLFAFSSFWAYLWFSQYLLIWYSNIPEETVHYAARLRGTWKILFWANPLVNFVAPFIMLLSAKAKSRERTLGAACAVIVLGHVLDAYLLVMPPLLPEGPRFGWIEASVLLGGASGFVLLFERSFAEARPVPLRDPYLVESLHHLAS